MKNISELIIDYLILNTRLSIHKLGIFSKTYIEAKIHPIIHEFTPPAFILHFEENYLCKTSAHFIEFVAQKTNTSAQKVAMEIENFAIQINEKLQLSKPVKISLFGVFKKESNGKISFKPDENINLNVESFGLPVFTIKHNEYEEENKKANNPETISVSTTSDGTRQVINNDSKNYSYESRSEKFQRKTKITLPHRKRKPIPKVLIGIFIFCSVISIFYFSGIWKNVYEKAHSLLFYEPETDIVLDVIEPDITTDNKDEGFSENKFFPASDNEQTEVEEKTKVTAIIEEQKFFIVADCFRDSTLAIKRADDLLEQGYNSCIAGQTKQGLHIVAYGGYTDKSEAIKELRNIRQKKDNNAWLYARP